MAKAWYILQTFNGYEGKIERRIRSMIENGDLDSNIVLDIKVPMEEVVEVKDGKKRVRNSKLLSGYVMLQLDLPEIGWKDTCSSIRRLQGVNGFVGTNPSERPRPISAEEAKNLLQRSGDIKGEKTPRIKSNFELGETVKIIDGAFASFSGTIEEIQLDREKLQVMVQIFGRATKVEVGFLQVEKA